jgi:hypothetical protein
MRFEKEGSSWRHVTALSWSGAGGEPAMVRLERDGGRWTVRAGSRSAVIHWQE